MDRESFHLLAIFLIVFFLAVTDHLSRERKQALKELTQWEYSHTTVNEPPMLLSRF